MNTCILELYGNVKPRHSKRTEMIHYIIYSYTFVHINKNVTRWLHMNPISTVIFITIICVSVWRFISPLVAMVLFYDYTGKTLNNYCYCRSFCFCYGRQLWRIHGKLIPVMD